MRRIGVVFAYLMLVAVSAFAQGTVDAERLSLWTSGSIRANLTAGSGAPTGGTLGDYYIDYLTANLYRRISGSWEVVPMVSLTNTWTAAQAFNAGWTGTTGSLSSTLHVGGNFDVGTTRFTVTASTGATTINANAASLPSPLAGTLLQIGNTDGTSTRIVVDAFANAAQLTLRRASTTAAAPAALASGDIIGRVGGLGYGSTGYASGSRASVDFVAAQTWTDSAQGAYLGLMTTSNGSTTLTERVRVQQSGGVSIGTPTTDPGANNLGITGDVLPFTNYVSSAGSITSKLLAVHAGELVVQSLVAQQTQATIGGRIIVAPTNVLTAALAAAGTTMTVKYNNLSNGDRVYLEAGGNVEWMAVTSAAGGSAGAYTYSVTRNLDGSGANNWIAGDAVLDTGTTGNGYIDLFSTSGVLSGSGPTIVGNVRTGTTYSNIANRWAIGNLRSLYGYAASDIYGAAFGDPSATNITIDATNGIRIRNSTTNKLVIDTGGGLTLTSFLEMGTSGQFYSTGVGGFTTGTGWYLDYNGGTPRFRVGNPSGVLFSWNGTTLSITDASISINGGTVTLDSTGLFISPRSASGGGTFANANAVRWTTDTTYRTAIWRSDSTSGSLFREWNFEQVQDGTGGSPIADTRTNFIAKNNNTSNAYGQSEIRQRGTSGNLGETLIVGHSWDTSTDRYGYMYVGADDSAGARKAVIGVGTPPALTASSVDAGTVTVGFEITPTGITTTGNFLDEIGIANSTATIRTTIQPGFAGTSTATDFVLLANNGSVATVCNGGGITVGAPTGGCKGAGTANFGADIYKNNTAYTNPDYVFEHWATGKVVKFAGNEGAATYRGLMPLDELQRYVRTNYRFPMISDAPVGAFGRADIALALTEQNTLYIFQLSERISALEHRIATGGW